MTVVSNTTPLNYLILTETVDVLPAIFGRVYVPSAVIDELSHPRSPAVVRAWVSSLPAWITVQDPAQIDPLLNLGAGEAAAISLALEIGADRILIDERKGYKVAQQRGLGTSSTLGVFEEASHRGLINFEEKIGRLVKETTFYITEDVLQDFRRRIQGQEHARQQEQPVQDPDAPKQP
jgi:predicted nucleic acid-binding protein